MHKISQKHQRKISYRGVMLNRSLLNLGLYILLLETRVAFSCPSFLAPPLALKWL